MSFCFGNSPATLARRGALLLAFCSVACGFRAPPRALPPEPPVNLAPIAVQVTSSRDEHAHPVVRARNYAVDSGRYSIEVDPADGARIVSFSLDGKNVLVTREDSPEAYGSSFWPSPQSDWSWPPPLEIDKRPWHVSAKKNALELESAVNPALGLSVKQRITLDGTRGVATITYTLENHGSAPRKVAPWQNSRTRPGGLTFYASDTPSTPESDLKLEPQKGVIWFLHDPSKFTKGVKSFSDGKGWLAHVDGDLLFVKVFPDLPPGAQAPKEAEIELYVDGAGRFVEVEQQGAYVELPPGGHSTWTVHWLVEQLPASVEPSLGNAALVAHAQAMAARVQR